MTDTTYKQVVDSFKSIPGSDISWNSRMGRAVVTVPDESVGKAFAALRRGGFDSRQKRLGDTVVYHVDAERTGLRGLFE